MNPDELRAIVQQQISKNLDERARVLRRTWNKLVGTHAARLTFESSMMINDAHELLVREYRERAQLILDTWRGGIERSGNIWNAQLRDYIVADLEGVLGPQSADLVEKYEWLKTKVLAPSYYPDLRQDKLRVLKGALADLDYEAIGTNAKPSPSDGQSQQGVAHPTRWMQMAERVKKHPIVSGVALVVTLLVGLVGLLNNIPGALSGADYLKCRFSSRACYQTNLESLRLGMKLSTLDQKLGGQRQARSAKNEYLYANDLSFVIASVADGTEDIDSFTVVNRCENFQPNFFGIHLGSTVFSDLSERFGLEPESYYFIEYRDGMKYCENYTLGLVSYQLAFPYAEYSFCALDDISQYPLVNENIENWPETGIEGPIAFDRVQDLKYRKALIINTIATRKILDDENDNPPEYEQMTGPYFTEVYEALSDVDHSCR